MFQGSFSKFTKCLVAVSMVFCVLFFVGCGKEEEKSKDDGNLPEIPNVGGNDGKLDERNDNEGAGGDPLWKNNPVTAQNLEEFEKEFLEAISGGTPTRAAATRKVETEKDSTKYLGDHGYKINEIDAQWENDEPQWGKTTILVKYFNFSQTGKIFFGGAAGFSYYGGDKVREGKLSGEIKFNGVFQGSVVYRDFYEKLERAKIETEWGETIDGWKKVSSSGAIVVKSGGKEFDFKPHLEQVFSMSLGIFRD